MKEPLLTVKEVAAWLRVKPQKIYELCAARAIPFRRQGRHYRFLRDELEQWVRERWPGVSIDEVVTMDHRSRDPQGVDTPPATPARRRSPKERRDTAEFARELAQMRREAR